MNKKINIFVCILIALSINLQCNISAYAEDENTTLDTEKQDLDKDTEISSPIIEGSQLSADLNADDQMEQN